MRFYVAVIMVTLVQLVLAYHGSSRSFIRRRINREKFTALAGSITSPDYPNDYPRYMNNYYEIILPEGKTIHIEVNDIDIEAGDKLDVYVVKDNEYQLLRTISHDDVGKPIETNTNLVLLHFASDHGGSGRGFSIDYTTTDKTRVARRYGSRLYALKDKQWI